jgi:hypothetical protein
MNYNVYNLKISTILLQEKRWVKGGETMNHYGRKTDSELETKHRSYKTSRSERHKIEREMEYRGYEHDGIDFIKEQEEEEEVDEDGFSILTALWYLFLLIIFAAVIYNVVIYSTFLSDTLMTALNGVKEWYPRDVYINKDILTDKPYMNFFGLLYGGIIAALSLLVRKYRKWVAALLGTFSIVILFQEALGYASFPVFSFSVFLLVFAVCTYLFIKVRSVWKAGIFVILLSTVGYILAGNGIHIPWFILNVTGGMLIWIWRK